MKPYGFEASSYCAGCDQERCRSCWYKSTRSKEQRGHARQNKKQQIRQALKELQHAD